MTETGDRDWRTWAYLQKDNWPEAIPWDGPHREHGPRPWSAFATDDHPNEYDDYPHSHTSAGSIGEHYLGDVCPYCGVPLSWFEDVVTEGGDSGEFAEITELDNPVPAYHPGCWRERQTEKHGLENPTLGEW